MTSDQKIQANRENSLLSTGPKTQSGLRRASMNALKHGLTAKTFVIPGENANEFEELHSEFLSAWSPVNMIEADLVGQLAISTWIMRRVSRIETEKFIDADEDDKYRIKKFEETRGQDLETRLAAAVGLNRDRFPYFDKLIKYGAVYERRYYRALHTLIQLRDAHASEQALTITTDETKAIEAPMIKSEAVKNSEWADLP